MSAHAFSILTQPGWTNSGPDHWHSHWERAHPDWQRVEQRDWERPQRDEWVQTLCAAIAAAPHPVVVLAHSIGVATVVHAAPLARRRIAGALLVAPADVDVPQVAPKIRSFAPLPLARLPFPSLLFASRDDTWCTYERACVLAEAWGSRVIDAGTAGHLHTDAGYGPWPEGLAMLKAFLSALAAGDGA